ncbi:kinase-like domain-containing protein [Rhizophagus irregularis DAOM 181602=DAOM 197198]|nr:kinase-like domain-containing protein [Rhizophagus irregularis DAOM 181602=DAOM 197198]
MSNNTESNVPTKFAENTNDEWVNWIEEAIAKDYFKYYEFNIFSNLQEISFGGFGKVYRANWRGSHNYLALKSFFSFNDATIKEIVKELKIQREVDFHENIIHFCGVTIENQNDNSKKYWLVMEYADSGTLQEYLKICFDNLTWDNKFDMAFQLANAILCLHDKGIIHRDLHSKNVLVHQNMIKLADFGLSKRIEESSNLQSTNLYGKIPYVDPKSFSNQDYKLNKKSDIYSIGILLWEISSGKPPFYIEDKSYDICLSIDISQGLRETPIPDTPINYINIYTDCWNNEPDDRPTINQVVSKLNAIAPKNSKNTMKNFWSNDSHTNIQLSSNQQLNLSVFKDSNNNLSHGELSKIIQKFNKINIEEIKPSITSDYDFKMIVDEIVEFLDMIGEEKDKRNIYDSLNNYNMTSREIYIWLLNNQHYSNSVVLLGDFNYLGIEINVDVNKAFELYQKSADLENEFGINNLGYCYQNGIGTDIDEKKAFELYQVAADLGNASGIDNLGYCYQNGIGTKIDEKKAFELYQKAADLGNTPGIDNLGYCYQNGIGTDISEKKAFELYQKAADLGNAFGMENLGYCYEKGIGTGINNKKAFELYQKTADLGNASGMNNLGYCYQNGIGIDINSKKAFELYQKSANLGNALGIYNFGCCYQNGIGTDINNKKAFELYQKAADLENAAAINTLGNCHLDGFETDINEEKAFELYQLAADLGDAFGIENLGYCYQNGIWVDINDEEAFELYQKAADLGNASGINKLGYCYQYGIGTNTNEKKAFELYQKAADLGDTSGIDNLEYCNQNGIGTDIDEKKSI